MINRLRTRIILVNMMLVGVVILMIVGIVCINSYKTASDNLERGMNETLMHLNREESMNDIPQPVTPTQPADGNVSNNDTQDDKDDQDNQGDDRDDEKIDDDNTKINIGKREFHGDNPMLVSSYVVVSVDKDGSVLDKKESNVTIDSDTLAECVKTVISNNNRTGQIGEYGLMYIRDDYKSKTKIIFSDSGSIYDALRGTIFVSLALFAGSMVVVFLISLVLSGFAVKPVKRAWDQQKQFVADASHELKTPLTVILANNNIMSSHGDSKISDERQWLESTEEEAQHMKKLIEQMLFLAKSDASTTPTQLSDVNFSEIVEGDALNFEPVAFEKNITIDTNIDSEVMLLGNQTQLRQLAHILIDNAVKYGDEGTEIKIYLKKNGDMVRFSVNNRGNVIPPEELKHIFDRFYRAEKSRTTKGYGLGLSIAQKIVSDSNGRLWAESDEQNGTTFFAVFKNPKHVGEKK